MSDCPPIRKILILAANPVDAARRRLDQEVREIGIGLKLASQRDQFDLRQQWAVRPTDIRRALFETAPQIVHFCGHGEEIDGLTVEDDSGKMQLVPAQALADFFGLFEGIECVLLNACYSEEQAAAISQHIPYVIGMSRAIGDRTAIEFAIGFYDALGAGRTYEAAYRFGCNAIALQGIPDALVPKIKKRAKTHLSPKIPPQSTASQSKAASAQVRPKPKPDSASMSSRSSLKRGRIAGSSSSSPDSLLALCQRVWIFLLLIVVVWISIGVLGASILDAPGSDQGGLLFLGAFGGLLSGILGAIAQRQVSPNFQLEQILLRCIFGMISGIAIWIILALMFNSVEPGSFNRNGLHAGLIAGLSMIGIIFWQVNHGFTRQ